MNYKKRLKELEDILLVGKSSVVSDKDVEDIFENEEKKSEDESSNFEKVGVDHIDNAVIDIQRLRDFVYLGLPEERHRALVWRLLLNFLPPDTTKWKEVLVKKRELYYEHFIKGLLLHENVKQSDKELSKVFPKSKSGRLLLSPLECQKQITEDGGPDTNFGIQDANVSLDDGNTEFVASEDHPLNPNPDSKWQTFFKDNEVLLQIDKDVRRLYPEMSFFQSVTPYPNKYVINGQITRLHERIQHSTLEYKNVVKEGIGLTKMTGKSNSAKPVQLFQNLNKTNSNEVSVEASELHWEVVERILFLYAKLNPGQSYVQGMNEIIGPIYYTLANDPDEDWREHAEPDTFFLFTNLMGEIRDFFIRSLDNSRYGIKHMMELLMNCLEKKDPEVHNLLKHQGIHPQYFSFRWITLLLSQEFPLPEVLRIWDSLLSDPKRFNFLIHLCCAMIYHIRKELLVGDFPANMKMLQNYPVNDVRDILSLACQFYESSFKL